MTMRMRSPAAVVAAILVGALAMVACQPAGGPRPAPTVAAPATQASPPIVATPPGPFSVVGRVSVAQGQATSDMLDTMRFSPNVFTNARPGQQVSVEFVNRGVLIHTFVSPDLGVPTAVTVQPGQRGPVTFTAPTAPGAYWYWCDVPGHAEAGMVGQVIVE